MMYLCIFGLIEYLQIKKKTKKNLSWSSLLSSSSSSSSSSSYHHRAHAEYRLVWMPTTIKILKETDRESYTHLVERMASFFFFFFFNFLKINL
jgi:hypothetical protein